MIRQRSACWTTMVCAAALLTACGQAGTSTTAPLTAPPATATAATAKLASQPPPTPVVTDAPLPALELLWEAAGESSATGAAAATYSPTVDPLTGDIWVAASFDGVIWIISKDGEYKGSFGKPGSGEGEFDFERSACHPCGAGALAFAPDGSLFVADTGNNRIQKFDAKHAFVTEWGSFGSGQAQFADANQIATDGTSVFVTDDARADIQVFAMDGTYRMRIPTAGWLAIDTNGDLLVSHNEGTVERYRADGTFVSKLQLKLYQGAEHIGLAVDSHGRVFYDLQDPGAPYDALGLGATDMAAGSHEAWSTGGETITIQGDVLYAANFVTPSWPAPVLRAYAIPTP